MTGAEPPAYMAGMNHADEPPRTRAAAGPDFWSRLPKPLSLPAAIPAALLLTAAATGAALALLPLLPAQSLSLVFLPCVLLAAVCFGLGTGLATAVASFLAFNFFFIPPIYTFRISDPQDILALIVFFAVAVMTGSLAGRMREVADDARRRAAALQGLNDLAARLSAATTETEVFAALTSQAAATVHGKAILFAAESGDDLAPVHGVPEGQDLASADWQAARQTLRSGADTYPSVPGWPGARYEFRVLNVGDRRAGVLGILRGDAGATHPEDGATLDTMLRHAGVALARTRLQAESLAARSEIEKERLRSTLLSSLSHDLRTPLASILGSVTSLRELGDRMPEEARNDLLAAIEEETGRLSLFVANLLDMTRLESGSPDLDRDWIDVADCAQASIARARRLFPGRAIEFTRDADLPLVRGDATLIDHVLFNLFDNAIKFSPAGSMVRVRARRDRDLVILEVTDDGEGISPDMLPRVFDKHFRAVPSDRKVAGTGLGLTICRRVVDAIGGTIEAASPVANGRGTRMTIRLPAATQTETAGAPDREGREAEDA